jgi:hypothetical protein
MKESEPGVGQALGNDRYRGMAFGWIFLVLMGIVNLGRGSIHVFRSDGGAASIAGIDLSRNGEVILALFATMGLAQILLGAIDLAVGLRYRALAPLLLGYHLLQQMGVVAILWWWRPLPVQAPGKLGAVVLIPVAALALFCGTRRARSAPHSPCPPGPAGVTASAE